MNIALKITSPVSPESYSTFDVGANYNAHQFYPWTAYLVKARPHIAFRHEGVMGEGKTLDDAMLDLHRRLYERLTVALECRLPLEKMTAKFIERYDSLVEGRGTLGAPSTESGLQWIEQESADTFFEAGWTIREWWRAAAGVAFTVKNLMLWRAGRDNTGKVV